MVQIQYENGSMGHLTYTSLGGPKMPRERVEIFCGDTAVEVVDFKRLQVNGRKVLSSGGMGHENELEHFVRRVLDDGEVDKNQLGALWASWMCLKANEIIKGENRNE